MFDLAAMYEAGRGVPADLTKARDLYRRAAVLGNAEAQAALARFKND
jgi:TPR repeat protein